MALYPGQSLRLSSRPHGCRQALDVKACESDSENSESLP